MKLLKLSGPRPVVLYNDDAFEESCQKPGPAPSKDDVTEAEVVAYERAAHRFDCWTRYMETYDLAHLEPIIRPGAKPVVFMCGQLSPEQVAEMSGLENHGARMLHAVTYSVREILNLEIQDETGKSLGTLKTKQVDDEFGKRLCDEGLMVFTDYEVLIGVASHVLASTRLPRGLRKSD